MNTIVASAVLALAAFMWSPVEVLIERSIDPRMTCELVRAEPRMVYVIGTTGYTIDSSSTPLGFGSSHYERNGIALSIPYCSRPTQVGVDGIMSAFVEINVFVEFAP